MEDIKFDDPNDFVKDLSKLVIDIIYIVKPNKRIKKDPFDINKRYELISKVTLTEGNDNVKILELDTLTTEELSRIRATVEKHKYYRYGSSKTEFLPDSSYIPLIQRQLRSSLSKRIFKGAKGYYQFITSDISVKAAMTAYHITLPFKYFTNIITYLEVLPTDIIYVLAYFVHESNTIINLVKAAPILKEQKLLWESLFQRDFRSVYQKILSKQIPVSSWYDMFVGFTELVPKLERSNFSPLKESYRIAIDHGLSEYANKAINTLKMLGVKIELYNAYAEQRAMEM